MEGIDAEMDARRRFIQGVEKAGGVVHHLSRVICRAKRADPTVEDLHRLRACCDLRVQDGSADVRQLLHEEAEGGGLPVHERLGRLVVPGGPAFDEVCGERERRACEADKRYAACQGRADCAYGVEEI